jgi:hypothetical protein
MTHMSPPDENRRSLSLFLGGLVFLVTLALLGVVIGNALVQHRAAPEFVLATSAAQGSATPNSADRPTMTMTVTIMLPAMLGGAPETSLPTGTLTAAPTHPPTALPMPSNTPTTNMTVTATPSPTPTGPILIRPTRARPITPLPLLPVVTPTDAGSP